MACAAPPLCRKPRILVTYLPKVLQELLQRHTQASMGQHLPANISEDADLYGRPAEPFVVPTIWGMWDGGVDIHFALPRMAVMHGMRPRTRSARRMAAPSLSDLEHWLVSTLVALLRKQSRKRLRSSPQNSPSESRASTVPTGEAYGTGIN